MHRSSYDSHPSTPWPVVALVFLLCLPLSFLHGQSNLFRLAPVFQDTMVLQQRTTVSVWGEGIPGTRVTVRGSWGKGSSTVVSADSAWTLKLPTPKAGGPFTVSIRHGDSTRILRDVLVGEVWLCSGQSNMEMPLEGWPPTDTIANFAGAIDHAANPRIRLFKVQRNYAAAPISECTATWRECSPSSVRSFSATAYFFGKRLNDALKVPIGLIDASWGGTAVESWMSRGALSKFSEFSDALRKIEECKDSIRVLSDWLSRQPTISVLDRAPLEKWNNLSFEDSECSDRSFPDGTWPEMSLPLLWERTSLGEFDGVVWFRKQVEIPSLWVGKPLTLHLGPIDDMDDTYVNGMKVGETMKDGFWKMDRAYAIPDSVVRDTVLQIAVRVVDTQGGGGIWGERTSLFLSTDSSDTKIPLAGAWKYLPVAEYRSGTFWVFGAKENRYKDRPKLPFEFTGYSPTALFNGMISPLVPFTLKGAIWYQGESNTGNPAQYKETFPAMIADWRKAFHCGDFPFYYVQIAPFEYGPQTESQYLREAQMRSLKVKNTGMIVTMDIGNPTNIHPANKKDVGGRLASWALAKNYGKTVVYSGPIYKSMKVVKGTAVLSFDYAGKGLVLRGAAADYGFQIAGPDKIFKNATLKVEGTKLVVSHPEIKAPAAVRYAWSNTAPATLFNKEGLPASSFRTDAW